jgi:hypothetical protein
MGQRREKKKALTPCPFFALCLAFSLYLMKDCVCYDLDQKCVHFAIIMHTIRCSIGPGYRWGVEINHLEPEGEK